MKRLTNRDLKVLTLLSIVVPVSLLITFRLIGILPEPEGSITIAETTTLDTLKWEFERPGADVNLWDKVRNSYKNGNLSMAYDIFIDDYDEGSGDYGGHDYINLIVNLTSTVESGYIANAYLLLRENYENSRIILLDELSKLENLSMSNLKDWSKEAFINLTGTNRPASVSLWVPVHWVLRSPNNQTHTLEIVAEVTYFDGTVYKKAVQPFHLRLIGEDDNDGFETADEITLGSHKAYIDEDFDPVDYYKIWLEQEWTVKATVTHPFEPFGDSRSGLDMYLYDSNRQLVAQSLYGIHEERQLTFTAANAGYWYVKLEYYVGDEIYTLNLTLLSP